MNNYNIKMTKMASPNSEISSPSVENLFKIYNDPFVIHIYQKKVAFVFVKNSIFKHTK